MDQDETTNDREEKEEEGMFLMTTTFIHMWSSL